MPPTRPTFFRFSMPAMPVTTVQKMISVMIIDNDADERVAQRLHRHRASRVNIAQHDGEGDATRTCTQRTR